MLGYSYLLGAVYDDIGEVPAAITSRRRLLITRRAERPWWFAPIALNVHIGHPRTVLEAAVSGHKVLPNAERPPGKLADSAPEPAMGTKPTGMEPAAAQLMGECLRLGIGVYLIVLGVALLAAIPWARSFASSLIGGNSGITVTTGFFGVKFSPSAYFSLLLIVLINGDARQSFPHFFRATIQHRTRTMLAHKNVVPKDAKPLSWVAYLQRSTPL
jgi:hypothetical protein